MLTRTDLHTISVDCGSDGCYTGRFGERLRNVESVIAWPATYRNSGIMTFMVGPEGVVYQRDLGENTSQTGVLHDCLRPRNRMEGSAGAGRGPVHGVSCLRIPRIEAAARAPAPPPALLLAKAGSNSALNSGTVTLVSGEAG